MLLLLTLVYLFHGFQTHAAPRTSLLAESSGNTTVISIPACICPADQRSLWNILWSCLATTFACPWLSVHPNIPAPNESRWRIFLRRLELMLWAVVSPELIISWAFRQWLGARRLENLYKDRGWTKAHGHFIQMGGFMLFEGNIAKGVLSPDRVSELLTAGNIEFPTVTVEEIEDRSKADGFSKTIALGQTLWFVAQCLLRRPQHLDLTLIELLTLSLADHFIYSLLQKLFTYILGEISNWRRKITIIWQPLPNLSKVLILIPLTIMIPFLLALTFSILLTLVYVITSMFLLFRWITILVSTTGSTGYRDFNIGDMKVPTFYSTGKDGDERAYIFLTCAVGVVFGGIHCVGWFFNFPSSDEAMLWRVSSAVLTGSAVVLPLLVFLLGIIPEGNEQPSQNYGLVYTTGLLQLLYVVSRLLMLVEAFISLRHLTPGMLALVKWTSFIPHI